MLRYDDDPLAWWKSHASDFPRVARTAKTVLSLFLLLLRPLSASSAQPAKYFAPKDQTHYEEVRTTVVHQV